MTTYAQRNVSIPSKVVDLISKCPTKSVTAQDIQSTDDKIRSRRKRFGLYELFVWVLAWKGQDLIMARKADEWGGKWTLLGGAVEAGEAIEAAAIREAKEESGLDIRLRPPVAVIQSKLVSPTDKLDYFLVLFQADVIGGEMVPLDKREIAEARLVRTEDLLQLVSEHKFPGVHPNIDNAILECLGLSMTPRYT